MRKRYVILGLSVVLALALAVPAFGGPKNPVSSGFASIRGTANKALKKAKLAQQTANSALAAAQSATTTAKGAEGDASKANTEIKKLQTSVTTAQNTANSAKSIAEQAKSAAAAAEANANSRLKGSVQVVGETSANTEGDKFATAVCGENQATLGGGYVVGGTNSNKVTVQLSEKAIYNEGWFVGGRLINGQTGSWTLQAFAICGTK